MCVFYKNKDLEDSSVPLQTQKSPGIGFGKKGLACTIVNFLNEATLCDIKSHLEHEQQRFTSV